MAIQTATSICKSGVHKLVAHIHNKHTSAMEWIKTAIVLKRFRLSLNVCMQIQGFVWMIMHSTKKNVEFIEFTLKSVFALDFIFLARIYRGLSNVLQFMCNF